MNSLKKAEMEDRQLQALLIVEIQAAAEDGQPFTKSGHANGIWEHKHEFKTPPLKNLSKHKIQKWVDELIESGEIVLATNRGSTAKKWLDIPGGDFAEGREVYRRGSRSRGEQ